MRNSFELHLFNKIVLFTGLTLFSTASLCAITLTEPIQNSLQFIVIGDWGMQGNEDQRNVASAMDQLAATTKINFIFTLGDNFYPKGVKSVNDPLFKKTFEDVYSLPNLKTIPWYITLGNHDYMGNIYAEINYAKKNRNWNIVDTYYEKEFEIGEHAVAQFLFLDTNPYLKEYQKTPDFYHHIDKQNPAKQSNWIRENLEEKGHTWKIALGHHPVFTSGAHGDTEELKEIFIGLFDKNYLDAYFAGHDHHLEHIKTLSPTHYFISGGGGAKNRPVGRGRYTKYSEASLGFIHVKLDERCMQVRFIDEKGKQRYEIIIPAKLVVECH